MLVFEELLEISYSFLRPEVQCGALCLQEKADPFFAAHMPFQCVSV